MEKTELENKVREDVVCGINPVIEALRSGKEIESLLVSGKKDNGKIARILAECAKRSIIVKEVSPKKLDFLCGHTAHQGAPLRSALSHAA